MLQRWMKSYEEVCDECSSGVMRMVHVAHSIPGVCSCVQYITRCLIKKEDPITSNVKRKELKKKVQEYERYIKDYKLQIDRYETEIKLIETENGEFIF